MTKGEEKNMSLMYSDRGNEKDYINYNLLKKAVFFMRGLVLFVFSGVLFSFVIMLNV